MLFWSRPLSLDILNRLGQFILTSPEGRRFRIFLVRGSTLLSRNCGVCGQIYHTLGLHQRNPSEAVALSCGHICCHGCATRYVDRVRDPNRPCEECENPPRPQELRNSNVQIHMHQANSASDNGRPQQRQQTVSMGGPRPQGLRNPEAQVQVHQADNTNDNGRPQQRRQTVTVGGRILRPLAPATRPRSGTQLEVGPRRESNVHTPRQIHDMMNLDFVMGGTSNTNSNATETRPATVPATEAKNANIVDLTSEDEADSVTEESTEAGEEAETNTGRIIREAWEEARSLDHRKVRAALARLNEATGFKDRNQIALAEIVEHVIGHNFKGGDQMTVAGFLGWYHPVL